MRFLLVVLLLTSSALTVAAAPPDDSVVIDATDNSYVVADINAPDDPQGLRTKNFGGLEFLKIWYASQVQAQEQIVSVGLVKFDLSGLKDREVRSAHLQLFATRADLLQPVRLVDVSVAEGQWTQSDVTFSTLPQISNPALASAAVYAANTWYSWDVTPAVVRKAKDGNVAYAIGLRTIENRGEEQVVFASTEAGRNAPRLVVTMTPLAQTLPLYALPVGIAAAALLAFAGGIALGRRRRGFRRAPKVRAEAAPLEPAVEYVDEDIISCRACQRQIPASAEVCPRCGVEQQVGRESETEPLVR